MEHRAQPAHDREKLLALLLKKEGFKPAQKQRITPRPRVQPLPLSFGQQRLWFLDQLEPGNPAYTLRGAVKLTGMLDVAALAHSLAMIVTRHEVLRTTFDTVEGQPVQRIAPAGTASAPHLSLIDLQNVPSHVQPQEYARIARRAVQRPFDLRCGPLFRPYLLRLAPSEHILLLTMHHIVGDGWSIDVLLRELAALYPAFTRGQPPALTPLPIQYVDYAFWQREWLHGPARATQLQYWKTQLAGAPPLLELPTDRPRPAVQTARGATEPLTLSPALTAALQTLGRQAGATLFMTLLAAFQALLARYSGQEAIVVGTDSANRTNVEIEGLIGFFVNQLVLCADLSGQPTVLELLRRVREVVLEAYNHQELPFEQLVEELQPARSLSYNPLFQVLFTFRDAPREAQKLGALALTPLEIDSETAQFDLALVLEHTHDRVAGVFEYNTDLFDAQTIQRMAGHFLTLLEGFVAHPDANSAALPLLAPAERQRMMVDWNATQAAFPQHACLHELFDLQAAQTPDAVAVVCEEVYLTYHALYQQAQRMAQALIVRGIGPNQIVGLFAERGIAFLTAILAVFKAGGAYLPFDPLHSVPQLGQIVQQSRAALIVVAATQRALVDAVLERVAPDKRPALVTIEELLQENHANVSVTTRATPRDLAYVIYTSGSTGVPKGAMIEHRGMLNHLYAKISDLQLTARDRVVQTASQCFDISVWQFLVALLVGGQVHIFTDETTHNPTLLLDAASRATISILEIVPSLLRVMLDAISQHGIARPPFSDLRWLLLTGEALDPQLCRQWFQHYPQIPLLNAYGPTECSDDVTHHPIKQPPEQVVHLPIGRPIANTQIYILDRWLMAVPVGLAGELYVGGAGVGRGYLNDSLRTSAVFCPNPFSGLPGDRLYRTGDLARYQPDGTIVFLGRIDHQVKVRGFRIELEAIMAALGQHPAVHECIVITREDTPGDKRLVAYVVPNAEFRMQNAETGSPKPDSVDRAASPILHAPFSALHSGALRDFLQERLPDYMIPGAFVFLDALPLTANGKLDRQALPAPAHIRPELGDRYSAPRTPAEQTLTDIWGGVLGLDRIGIHDNFFELGGDSILSMQIIARAHAAGLHLTPKQIFQHQTIAQLALVAGSVTAHTADQELVTGAVPLTPIQQWFFAQNRPEPQHFNQALLLTVRESLHLVHFSQALEHVLVHHDALRLRFVLTDTGWQQDNAGIARCSTATLQVVDLTTVALQEQRNALEACAAQAQASLNLGEGRLLRAVYFLLGAGQLPRLLLVVHHLAIDGVSWRVLLEDIQTAYQQMQQGAAVRLPPKTTAFQHWATRLHEYAQSPAVQSERAYWLAQARPPIPALPCDDPSGRNTVADEAVVTVALSQAATQALLQDIPAAYQTQINDVLLTALAQTTAQWTGVPQTLVDLEGHGREELFAEVDLSRTVGWCTSLFPVRLDLTAARDAGTSLKTVKEQLRSIPQRGVGYGLLRYLDADVTRRAAFDALPTAAINFNYLGQLDQPLAQSALFAAADEGIGSVYSPRGQRCYVLEIVGGVSAGQLRLEWRYSGAQYRRATIERMAQQYLAALETLIAHCQAPDAGGYTPSDFPGAKLKQKDLDKVLAKLQQPGRRR